MKQEYLINSVDDLRNIIGDPNSRTVKKVTGQLDSQCRQFILNSPMVFVATSDGKYGQDVSPKGDEPGFVKVLDDRTLLIPERPGNKLAFGFLNILETGKIGLIFVVPGILETVRINGSARISRDPELLEMLSAKGKPAILCTIVTIEDCFLHCGKAFIRSDLWKPETWRQNVDFSAAEQLAKIVEVDAELVQKSLDEGYKNTLY